jgi:uncharacterized protein (TIGR02145 family)
MRYFTSILLVLFQIFATGCDDNSPVSPENVVAIEDNQYETIKIGTLTWTTSNYAGPGGIEYDESNSKPEYGKYYSMAELKDIELPEGWRIPTDEDYIALTEFYGITIPSPISQSDAVKSLTSTTHWSHVQGMNTSGFNAYPGGYIFGSSDPIGGDIAEFWTNVGHTVSIQEAGANLSSLRITFYDSSTSPDYRFNVRFVKG